MTNGHGCSLLTTSACQTTVLSLEVRILLPRAGPGGLAERPPDPDVAFGRSSSLSLTGRLLVARTDARPGGEVAVGGELVHVAANLCHEILDGLPIHPRNLIKPLQRGLIHKRGGGFPDSHTQRLALLFQVSQMVQQVLQHEAVMRCHPPQECANPVS